MPFSKQLTEALEISKGMPTYIDFGEGKKGIKKPKETVMDFARRSWNANRGQGKIKFFNKDGTPIKWKRGLQLPRTS